MSAVSQFFLLFLSEGVYPYFHIRSARGTNESHFNNLKQKFDVSARHSSLLSKIEGRRNGTQLRRVMICIEDVCRKHYWDDSHILPRRSSRKWLQFQGWKNSRSDFTPQKGNQWAVAISKSCVNRHGIQQPHPDWPSVPKVFHLWPSLPWVLLFLLFARLH